MLDSIHSSPVVHKNHAPTSVAGSLPVLANTYSTLAENTIFKAITKDTINFENLPLRFSIIQ
jgi:hypothetical protein